MPFFILAKICNFVYFYEILYIFVFAKIFIFAKVFPIHSVDSMFQIHSSYHENIEQGSVILQSLATVADKLC